VAFEHEERDVIRRAVVAVTDRDQWLLPGTLGLSNKPMSYPQKYR